MEVYVIKTEMRGRRKEGRENRVQKQGKVDSKEKIKVRVDVGEIRRVEERREVMIV